MSERIRLADLDEQTKAAVADTRRRVAALHAELPRWGLVVWTAGNVSERVIVDRGDGPIKTDLFVIKPSGVSYDELTADTMVVCTLDGEKIDDGTPASLTPSSDTAAHAYVYRHRDDVGGVVHTHSPYATAWAARREPIPCALTMMGDEFGGDIPIGPFALIGDDTNSTGIEGQNEELPWQKSVVLTDEEKRIFQERHIRGSERYLTQIWDYLSIYRDKFPCWSGEDSQPKVPIIAKKGGLFL